MSDLSGILGHIEIGPGPVFVHSDTFRAMPLVLAEGERFSAKDWKDILARHIDLLEGIGAGRSLWFPTFNYSYPRTRHFDIVNDSSEVGALSEHTRTVWSKWRTEVPIFSVCGNTTKPTLQEGGTIDPFDDKSIFSALTEQDGSIVFYGAPFQSITHMHYVERMLSEKLLYRYDKLFPGTIKLRDSTLRPVTLVYHVRPMGRTLQYDFDQMQLDGIQDGIIVDKTYKSTSILICSARKLTNYWLSRLKHDPLYFLNEETRQWVEPELDRLGRRFEIGDFEDGLG